MVNTNYLSKTAGSDVQNYSSKKTVAADSSFAQKVAEKEAASPADMTLEEYKAYFQKKIDSLYTHPSQRRICRWIDITDAAYERMRTDPEYEKKVLDTLAASKARSYGNRMPILLYTHIEDSWDKSYTKSWGVQERYPTPRTSSYKEKSWWEKRQERIKEMLKRQAKAAQKRAQAQSILGQQAALERQIESQQIRQKLFAEKIPGATDTTTDLPFSSSSAKALAAAFYAEALSAFSESLIRRNK